MTTPFENFVNTALGKSLSADVTLPTADEIPVFTGIGRQVTGKTIAELGLALSADVGVFSDSTFRIQDNDDAAKQLEFEVGGIATGETKTITMPNADVDLGNLSSVATTDFNTLSGTRTRIVGGLSNNVSGTDNIAVNSKGVAISGTGITAIGVRGNNIGNPDNNSIVLGSSNQTNLFILGTAATRRLNGLWASITTIPVAGTAYATIDGSQTLSNSNCLKAAIDAGATASHEVEFIVSVGLANVFGGCNPIGSFTAKRSINVHQAVGETYYTGTMQTIGTDESLGTISGTFTPSLTVDTENNRLVCSVVRAGGVAGQEAFALSVRTSTHDTR